MRTSLVALILLLGVSAPPAWAVTGATPELLAFQAHLADSVGAAITATQKIRFGLYVSGVRVWYGEYPLVAVTDGAFTVMLGDISQGGTSLDPVSGLSQAATFLPIKASLFTTVDSTTAVEVEVELFNGSSYDLVSPRYPMASAMFALRAATVGGFDASQLAKVDALGRIVAPSGTPIVSAAGNWIGPAILGSTGLTGASGASGASGSSGATGSTGSTGGTGAVGLGGGLGMTGATGASGVSGASGATGASGTTGASGATGATGAGASGQTGGTGLSGTSGATGASGASGASGATGSSGTTGTSGATGATGAGVAGSTGSTGTSGASGSSGTSGATGTTGGTGFSGATGATGPSPWSQAGGTIYFTGGPVGVGTSTPLAELHVVTGVAANTGLIIQGAGSQSANLTEWQNSGGTILAKVDASGNVTHGALTATSTTAPQLTVGYDTGTNKLQLSVDSGGVVTLGSNGAGTNVSLGSLTLNAGYTYHRSAAPVIQFQNATGASNYGRIYTDSATVQFYDYSNARYIFESVANGIGIGTNSPQAGYSVTMPSLYVSGTVTATTFAGALSGNSSTATAATNVTVTDDTAGAVRYPLWTTSTGSNLPARTTTSKLTFNPGTGGLSATTLASTVSTGTAPLTVSSTTLVTNLNAELLGGNLASAFPTLSGTNTWTNPNTFNYNFGIPLTITSTAAASAALSVSGANTGINGVILVNNSGLNGYGIVSTTSGVSVKGISTGAGTAAVAGVNSSGGEGVNGSATTGPGVHGSASGAGGIGVRGDVSGGATLAGYFVGAVTVTGAITVGSCTGCSVLAEMMPIAGPVREGQAVCIGSDDGRIRPCESDEEPTPLGITTTHAEQILRLGCADSETSQNALVIGGAHNGWKKSVACKGWYPVALAGVHEFVPVECFRSDGSPIRYGDRLISSGRRAGLIRPLAPSERSDAAVLGRAMKVCAKGRAEDVIHVKIR